MAVRSKAWFCCLSLVGTVGSNPAGPLNFVCYECCVLSGRDLCVGLITRPEVSYRLWCVCVCVCDHESSIMRRPWPTGAAAPRYKMFSVTGLITIRLFIQ